MGVEVSLCVFGTDEIVWPFCQGRNPARDECPFAGSPHNFLLLVSYYFLISRLGPQHPDSGNFHLLGLEAYGEGLLLFLRGEAPLIGLHGEL